MAWRRPGRDSRAPGALPGRGSVGERASDAGDARFDAAAFASLRERLEGVDLAQAVYLGRGIQVTAYRAGAWVIRVPRHDAARRKITRQTHVYQVLAACGLPVPRDAGVALDADGAVTAGFYRLIPGEPASAARRSAGLARDLGAFLSRLHAVAPESVRESCEVIDDPWANRFRARWDGCHASLPDTERGWLEEVIARFLASSESVSARPVPIHGDLVDEHVLVGPDGHLAGVIDPSGPWIADPALEFGTLAERFGWAFTDAVLAAYTLPLDGGFTRRACFCANLRPLMTIEAGLRHQSDERRLLGLRRLTERMADAREVR
jgi:aminoglycoside phosphotransferase (APT) family kinase protein